MEQKLNTLKMEIELIDSDIRFQNFLKFQQELKIGKLLSQLREVKIELFNRLSQQPEKPIAPQQVQQQVKQRQEVTPQREQQIDKKVQEATQEENYADEFQTEPKEAGMIDDLDLPELDLDDTQS